MAKPRPIEPDIQTFSQCIVLNRKKCHGFVKVAYMMLGKTSIGFLAEHNEQNYPDEPSRILIVIVFKERQLKDFKRERTQPAQQFLNGRSEAWGWAN